MPLAVVRTPAPAGDTAPAPEPPRAAVDEALAVAVESIRDYAIFRLTPDGVVAGWNRGAQRIYGWEHGEIVGRHFSAFYPAVDVDAGKCERELETAASDGRLEDDGWRLRKDGTLFWANVVITALHRDGELQGFVKVCRDMTERRHAEQALRMARDEAEHANRAKTEFLSRISHELRTPLTAILGFAELIEMEGPRADQRSHVAAILRAGEHLLDLINEVLDVSRIEAGNEEFRLRPVHLAALLDEVVELMLPVARSHGVSLKADPAESVEVMADQQRLKQVLLNLVSNAIKYNRPGGSVLCSSDARDGSVRIEVRDTGIGIDAGDMQRLFQPFERLGAERLHIEGTGLGLALSKRIVEAMEGRIGATSDVHTGTTFWVELPQAEQSAEVRDLAADSEPPHPATAVATTILYVEDNLANIELVEGILRQRPGARLLTAMQGQLGLDMARQHHPAALLLDVHLPDMDGESVLTELQRDPSTRDIPVVILSADAMPQQKRALLDAGALAYIIKPLRVKELLEVLDAATGMGAAADLQAPGE